MADNTELDAGSGGDTIRTDDDGTAKWQYVKLAYGPDNTYNIVGSTASNALPVALSDVDNAVLDAILTALQIIDDWDEADRAKVNPIVGQAGVAAGAGAVGVTVPRVTLASDDPAVALLTTIDSDTDTIAGDTTSIDGKITACDTGAVDIISVPRSIMGPAEPGTAVDLYTQVAINLTTGANQVLVSSAASKQIWVYGYTFTCGDADGQSVSFQDEDDTALSGIMEFAQYGGAACAPSGNFSMPIWKLGTDKDLEIDITGGDVDGWLTYAIVSV